MKSITALDLGIMADSQGQRLAIGAETHAPVASQVHNESTIPAVNLENPTCKED